MNQEGCFITYFDLANEVKEMARGYDFTVSSVEKFKKTGRLCYVWIVDEGDPATTVTRAFNMGYNVKNMEVKRWNRIIQERAWTGSLTPRYTGETGKYTSI